MAEINIEPRSKRPIWPWILGVLLLGGLIWFLTRDRDRDPASAPVAVGAAANDAADAAGNAVENVGDAAANVWSKIDRNAPKVDIPELKINSPDFEARGNDQYTIYSLGENLLFDTDKATLRADAAQNLKQVVASIKQRHPEGQIRVYGHADATAGAEHNKELSEQRAEAVKNWLTSNADMDASRISIVPVGENKPVASNQTEAGRQQNRRVEIVSVDQ